MTERPPKPVLVRAGFGKGVWWHLIRTESRRSYQMPYHRHAFAEMAWLSRGECELWLNGARRRLVAGEAQILRPADAHAEVVERDGQFVVTVVMFRREVMEALRRRHPDLFGVWWPPRGRPAVVARFSEAGLRGLDEAAQMLSRMPAARFAVEWFLLEAARMWLPAWRPADLPAHLPGWLAEALAGFRGEAALREGVPALVRRAGRSHEHVARMCRAHLGRAPREWVREMRMEEAKLRILAGREKLADIASAVGFESESHFFRVFRREVGVTPREYRLGRQPVRL